MKKWLGHFEDLVGIVVAGVLAPGPGAAIGAFCLIAAHVFPAPQGPLLLSRWWMADALGVLTGTPILLGIARFWTHGRPNRGPWFALRAFLYLVCVSAACYFIFFQPGTSYLLFSVFPLILIAAAWLGPTTARAAAIIISGAAIWATRTGIGAFAGGTLHENLQNLALFLVAASLTGMAVGAFRAVGNLALPAGVLLVGWALSGWLFASMDRDRTSYDEARLDTVITSVETRINSRLKTYEDVLWGASGLLATSERISPKDWHVYVSRLHLLDRYPGTDAIAVIQPVPHPQLESFVQARRRGESPTFAPFMLGGPPGFIEPFPEHFLVVCAEPAAVAARTIGTDLVGDSLRRTAAEQSRDSGAAVLTRGIALGGGSEKGLLLFVPVYREGSPLGNTTERKTALVAWVTVVFGADTFFRSALAEFQGMISLRAYDTGRAGAGDPFFWSGAAPEILRKPERITHLTLGGNTWTLGWNRLPSFPYLGRAPSAWTAGCTALLSLLLAGLVMTLQDSKRRASDRLKLIQSASTLGTWELDVDSGMVTCSEPLLRLYGIRESRERFPLEEWLGHVHPDDRETRITEIGGGPGQRESIDRQYRVVWPDGSTHWLHSKALPVLDVQGRPSRVVGVDFDISEIKQLQSQLAQAQKLESVGQLAAGIAHEINTPIQYVGDNAKFLEAAFQDLVMFSEAQLRTSLPPSNPGTLAGPPIRGEKLDEGLLAYLRTEVPKAIAQLLEGVDQVARIVRAMKEFSHPGPIEKTAVDINRAIESTILVSKNEWRYVAEVTTDFDPDLPPLPCVVGELNQVILNLIVNAAHAVSDLVKDSGRKGKIHISTRRTDSMVEIRISDTGTGIPEAIQSRVFDPFFTTKPVGKGTGQGLAIAHSVIVKKHDGALTFETEPGQGTTFVIQLPLACELETV